MRRCSSTAIDAHLLHVGQERVDALLAQLLGQAPVALLAAGAGLHFLEGRFALLEELRHVLAREVLERRPPSTGPSVGYQSAPTAGRPASCSGSPGGSDRRRCRGWCPCSSGSRANFSARGAAPAGAASAAWNGRRRPGAAARRQGAPSQRKKMCFIDRILQRRFIVSTPSAIGRWSRASAAPATGPRRPRPCRPGPRRPR